MYNNPNIYKGPKNSYFGPGKEVLSLKVDDIRGAQPRHALAAKNTRHYEERLISELQNFDHMLQRKADERGAGINESSPVPKVGKKHYNRHWDSEIAKTEAMKGSAQMDETHAFDFPRSLFTQDIPGALPGSLQSKGVRNHDMAIKIRRGLSVPKQRPGDDPARKTMGDVLEKVQPSGRLSVEPNSASPYMNATSTENRPVRQVTLQEPSGRHSVEPSSAIVKTEKLEESPMTKPKFRDEDLYLPERQERPSINDRNFSNASPFQQSPDRYYEKPDITSSMQNLDRNPQSKSVAWPSKMEEAYYMQEQRAQMSTSPYQPGLGSRSGSNPRITPYNEPNRPTYANHLPPVDTNMGFKGSMRGGDLKKIFTYNILSNQPVSKMVHPNARLPYRYALNYDFDKLNASDNSGAYAPIHTRNQSNTNSAFMMQQGYGGQSMIDNSSPDNSPLKSVYRGIRDSFKGGY